MRDALKKRGLDLQPSKSKVQHKCFGAVLRGYVHMRVDDYSAPKVLPEGGRLEMLGTWLALEDMTEIKMLHRVTCAWLKFWSLQRLCRIEVFRARRSWTPKQEKLRQLRVSWHSMLRRICGQQHRPEENCVDVTCRSTARARRLATVARARDCVYIFSLYKWA